MHTWEANKIAIGEHAKAVRESLRALGKRASLRWIYYQCQQPADVQRLDPYGLFWRWFRALWMAHRKGAEFLFEDFLARVEALREGERSPAGDWYEQVARCEQEHSEALREAILARDAARISAEIADDIREKRRLLVMLAARGAARRRAAA